MLCDIHFIASTTSIASRHHLHADCFSVKLWVVTCTEGTTNCWTAFSLHLMDMQLSADSVWWSVVVQCIWQLCLADREQHVEHEMSNMGGILLLVGSGGVSFFRDYCQSAVLCWRGQYHWSVVCSVTCHLPVWCQTGKRCRTLHCNGCDHQRHVMGHFANHGANVTHCSRHCTLQLQSWHRWPVKPS